MEVGEGVVPLAWSGGDPAVMAEGEGELLVLVGVEPSIARTCIKTSSQTRCCEIYAFKTVIACQVYVSVAGNCKSQTIRNVTGPVNHKGSGGHQMCY